MKSPASFHFPTPSWSADLRTSQAIERQAKFTGITPNAYLRQGLAAVIAGNEEATVVTKDGQLALRRARSPSESK